MRRYNRKGKARRTESGKMKNKAKGAKKKTILSRRDRVIVALDTRDLAFAKTLVHKLKNSIRIFKIGSEIFTAHGPKAVAVVRVARRDVFLDLKFHDIPNTVAQAVRAAVGLGVSIVNVHIPGGLKMMQEACIASADEARKHKVEPPKLIGVTLLTSLTEEDVKEQIGILSSIQKTALRYAALAQKAGLDGVVASAFEAQAIRAKCGPDFLVVTPGIRPEWASRDDQARVITPREAFEFGSDYIVIGRPITDRDEPEEAVRRIFETL